MAHPHLLAADDAPEQSVGMLEIQLSEAVFAALALLHTTTQDVRHELLPVADAEYWNPAVK